MIHFIKTGTNKCVLRTTFTRLFGLQVLWRVCDRAAALLLRYAAVLTTLHRALAIVAGLGGINQRCQSRSRRISRLLELASKPITWNLFSPTKW